MKTCPVCHGKVFDDMDTCFGCLHSFAGDEGMGKADRPIAPETKRRPKEWSVPQVFEVEEGQDSAAEEKSGSDIVEGQLHAGDKGQPSVGDGKGNAVVARSEPSEGAVGSFPLSEGYKLVISVERA